MSITIKPSTTCDQVFSSGQCLGYVFRHSDRRWYHKLMAAGSRHPGFAARDEAVQDLVAIALGSEVAA